MSYNYEISQKCVAWSTNFIYQVWWWLLHYVPFFCCHSNQKVGVTGSSPKMAMSILTYKAKLWTLIQLFQFYLCHGFHSLQIFILDKNSPFVKQILSVAFYSALENFNHTTFSWVSWYRVKQTGSHFLNFQHYDPASPVPKQGNVNNDMLISFDGTLFAQYVLCHNFTFQ